MMSSAAARERCRHGRRGLLDALNRHTEPSFAATLSPAVSVSMRTPSPATEFQAAAEVRSPSSLFRAFASCSLPSLTFLSQYQGTARTNHGPPSSDQTTCATVSAPASLSLSNHTPIFRHSPEWRTRGAFFSFFSFLPLPGAGATLSLRRTSRFTHRRLRMSAASGARLLC